jgi:hypothetical protein
VFLFIGRLFQKYSLLEWESKGFLSTLLSYALVQLIIAVMFADTYMNEIVAYTKRMAATQEFKYYVMIGMGRSRRYAIFNRKYGHNLVLKLIFQNILFVLNINWFIVYAFKVWRNFYDSMGVTYALSFENIFTKIVHYEGMRTGMFNFMLLIVLDAVLFAGYYVYQKRLSGK